MRGAKGGYTLARAPDSIRVGDVVRALEGPIEPVTCVAQGDNLAICARQSNCAARAVWERLRDSIVETLDSVTLADLIAGRVGKVAIEMPAR
ncbi:MAG: Rrf2 family transcriptional regulator [Bacteroidetes bacterium]|nr:Rrf2 family transcriptional regulator [Bacteroidota bacterium]MCL5025141.1 Rrf2 family transcriptional regulator [Chloroflexota bacterium]